ncbi:hypothetical protein FRB96_009666 [Tulasnella sp. 330]|nr:hypothetical protein FRB96_009666 [Tulasnella sp. 330]KAG8883299.1 hypothetical protein FRB97_006863 [Tulasnella sp. 331]KAG8888682.1 hypothetical protein FRB98_007048 [Tulasnella sp. 332]
MENALRSTSLILLQRIPDVRLSPFILVPRFWSISARRRLSHTLHQHELAAPRIPSRVALDPKHVSESERLRKASLGVFPIQEHIPFHTPPALEAVMNDEILKERREGSIEGVMRIVARSSKQGVRPSPRSVDAFLQGVGRHATLADVRQAEAIFGARADEHTWEIFVMNALTGKERREAMAILRGLLQNMANHNSKFPHSEVIDILGALHRLKLRFDPETTDRLIQALVKRCRTYQAMFDIYTRFVALGAQPTSHEALITLFRRSRERRSYPPPTIFFPLVESMIRAGYEGGLSSYRSYFNKIRMSMPVVLYQDASALQSNPNSDYLLDMHAAHAHLQASQYVAPDTDLLDLIMDGYSRSGDYEGAMRVWEYELWPSRHYSGMSISIIIDTCGHYGKTKDALRIWKDLEREERASPDRQISHKQWMTWIENLCRLELFDELLRVLVHELGPSNRPRGKDLPSWRLHVTEDMIKTPLAFRWKGGAVTKRGCILKICKMYGLP